jgi:hypothetical protein
VLELRPKLERCETSLLLGETILPILISAIIFAAAHGYPPRGALHVFTFGVLFGAIWEVLFALLIVAAAWVVSIITAVLAVDFRLPKAEPQIFVEITNLKAEARARALAVGFYPRCPALI